MNARVFAGAVLGLMAISESIVCAALTGESTQRALVLGMIALATTLPLALVAQQRAALIVVAASVASLALFRTLTVAAVLAQLIALHRLALEGLPRTRAQAIAICLSAAFGVLAFAHPVPTSSEAGALTLLLASLTPAAALAGVARQARGEAVLHAAAGDLLEHAARGERARIARELHDVVAHHISMIAVQAETARMATPGLPATGAQWLAAIGETARFALTEMRRLLGVLREDAQADTPVLRPQPRLEQLNELLDEARDASGSAARLILSGRPVSLDPGVELAAYRIVQEALTNARRHAPGAGVDVELHYGEHALGLRIRDTGPGPAAHPRAWGHGLSGMRERHRGRRATADRTGTGRRLRRRGDAAGGRKSGARVSAMAPAVRVIVADDHEVVRSGFAELLDTQPDFAVIGAAADGREAVRISRELEPDIVLMDIRMPGMDGIEATRQLAGRGSDRPRVLVLTTFDLDEYVYDALRAGASGFLLKDLTAERLFDAVLRDRIPARGDRGDD